MDLKNLADFKKIDAEEQKKEQKASRAQATCGFCLGEKICIGDIV